MNKNAKKKQGNTIYKRASVKLHPNKHLSEKDIATESFKQLGSLYSEFQKYINRN
jgi:curved DNA-binding protein CbpA